MLRPGPTRARPAAPALRLGASIAAVGMSVPGAVVTSAEIAERLGVSEEWILSRTGVRERRIAGEGDSVASLAAAAGRRALERAGVEGADLDAW